MRPACLVSVALAAIAACGLASQARAGLKVTVGGEPTVVFDTLHDGCTPNDMPDVNARAYRTADGRTTMFALYDTNRPLVGPDLDHLKPDCHVALPSPEDADPARFDDRNFVTATWTDDGRDVAALVHEEYHADHHRRCTAGGDLACWYNTILAYASNDGGREFARLRPAVVAAAPFRQDIDQGRHRGFFNPSNIVGKGAYRYALISTTGWPGQGDGVCLFRTTDPRRPGSWHAFDGSAFTIRYTDPYGPTLPRPAPCATLEPFVFPVGSLVLHAASRTWIAVFQARAGGAAPLDGLYYATSGDLLHWEGPFILAAGPTLFGDLCRAGPAITAYPSVLDPASPSRNYDTVGDTPELFFARIEVANCRTGRRQLMREPLRISWSPSP